MEDGIPGLICLFPLYISLFNILYKITFFLIYTGLVKLAYSTDEECAYHAALSFRKLAPNLTAHPIIIYAGG
jgi:hypothetical protein